MNDQLIMKTKALLGDKTFVREASTQHTTQTRLDKPARLKRVKRNPSKIRQRYFQIYLFKYASDFIESNSFNYTTFST